MARLSIQDAEIKAWRDRPWTFQLGDHYATGRGLNEIVEWAEVGGTNKEFLTWTELRAKVAQAEQAGDVYMDTPFIRMSPEGIAYGMAKTPVATPVPVTPVATPAGVVDHLEIARVGLKVVGYNAVDGAGVTLFQLTPDKGVQYARDNNLDIFF